MKIPVSVAIVGCGNWAEYTHIPCILKYGADIISCADINIKTAEAFRAKYNIPVCFDNYNEMLEKTAPDAVICLVSPDAVAEVASDILQKYPVMLEKPPGKTVHEASMIAEASKTSGKPHMVAFNRRFAPAYLKLKEIIGGNNSGIKYINYKMHRIKRHDSNFEDTLIHAVDAVKFLAGCEFKRVEIKYQEMPYLGENVANYYIYFECESGAAATADILVSTGELFEGCEIHTDTCIHRASLPLSVTDGGHYITQGFYNEHEHFYNCLINGVNPGNGADTAVQSVAICNAVKNRGNLLVF